MNLAFGRDVYDLHGAFPAVDLRVTMLSLQLVVLIKDQVANRISVTT